MAYKRRRHRKTGGRKGKVRRICRYRTRGKLFKTKSAAKRYAGKRKKKH